MANVQYYDVILKPVVTEKSMNAMSEKKYTFLVHPEANKTMIKEAVEKMFKGTKVSQQTAKTSRSSRVFNFLKYAATKAAILKIETPEGVERSQKWESKPITHIHLPEEI